MIKELVAVNYGCLKKVTAKLTPLHAFIGPNDSGKSTLLHGIRTVVQLACGAFEKDEAGVWQPFEPWLDVRFPNPREGGDGALRQRVGCAVEGGWYQIEAYQHERMLQESIGLADGWQTEHTYRDTRGYSDPTAFRGTPGSKLTTDCAPVLAQLEHARLVRFVPDALRQPSGLIPRDKAAAFFNEHGHGLSGIYQAILGRGDDSFSDIGKAVRGHFPTVSRIRVQAVTTTQLQLEVELKDGTIVPASRMSEGLLYYLAFSALRHLAPANILLVEEPENGLHPSRIADVVDILRTIAEEGTQVVMATHSPLVINELKPEEVTVVTRPSSEEGTQLTPIAETPNFAKRSAVYALGELWLSYANGTDEGPLLRGTAR